MNGNETLRSGQWWLDRFQGSLPSVVRFMATNRYGGAVDVDDRVSDALAALVEGSNRFQPQPGKDGTGYFLQYVLSYVAGALRNGAQVAKDWNNEAVTFSDIGPEELGIERLFETLPGTTDEEPDETQFVLNNGMVASTMEIISLITSDEVRRRIAAKKLGIQADDPGLPARLLETLDTIAGELNRDPGWGEKVPEPEPVIAHDLEAVKVTRNGVQTEVTGAEMRQLVEEASHSAVVWAPEESGVQYETDMPWPSWVEADSTRSYRSPYQDEATIPTWLEGRLAYALNVWREWHQSRLELGLRPGAGPILDTLLNTSSEFFEEYFLDSEQSEVAEAMLGLAEALADEPDGLSNTVACWLAEELVSAGLVLNRQGRLLFSFRTLFGLDGTGEWEAELPSVDGLRTTITRWVEQVTAQQGVWKSQATAIDALVLHDASPAEARSAARAAFARR